MTGFEFSVPVLVAGAGAAGVIAGLAAAEGGDVLLIERDAAPSGSTGMSQGLVCAAGTRAQRQAGVDDSGELLFLDILAKTRGQTDAALARTISDASGPCLDWLVDRHDVPLSLDLSYRAGFGHSRPRLHGWADHDGQALLDLLHDRLSAAGGQLLCQARLEAILTDEAGVTGIEISRPGGERDRIGCRALILACGGFAANRDMVALHMPEAAGALYNGHEASLGDAIALAGGVGAATADMGSYQGYGLLTTPHMITVPPKLVLEGAFLVNAAGHRFVDETEDITGLIHPVLAQPGGIAWLVYDDRIDALCAGTTEIEQLNALGAARMGASASDLSAAIGAGSDALAAAVAEICAAAAARRSDRFGREWPAETQPPDARLRALKVTGALYHTQGGIVTDPQMRVLDGQWSPIPSLYAAGGSARGLSGPSYWGYLPAMGLGSAVAGSAIAGRSAARSTSPKTVAAF